MQDSKLRSYQLINIIIAGLIIIIFIYSGIFSSGGNEYPVQCVHQKITGISCPSCGLSRSFSSLVRLDYNTAVEFNKYGPRVFLFFLLQLVLRVSNFFFLRRSSINISKLSRFDISLSAISFLLGFWQFLEYNIRLIF